MSRKSRIFKSRTKKKEKKPIIKNFIPAIKINKTKSNKPNNTKKIKTEII